MTLEVSSGQRWLECEVGIAVIGLEAEEPDLIGGADGGETCCAGMAGAGGWGASEEDEEKEITGRR